MLDDVQYESEEEEGDAEKMRGYSDNSRWNFLYIF